MSKEIILKDNMDSSHVQLIKDMYFKGCSNEELTMFLHVCKKTGLDPTMKQIFPVKRWDSKMKKEVMTVQTSIDGYRLIAERTGRYAPGREPTYHYNKDGKLISATSYVKKRTADGSWHEVAASAFYEEYVQTTKEGEPTQFWKKMAHNQLSKCAEALALRKAFPGDMATIYTKDEMAQSEVASSHKSNEIEPITVESIDMETGELRSQANSSVEDLHIECNTGTLEEVSEFVRFIAISKGWSEEKVINTIIENDDALADFTSKLTKRIEKKMLTGTIS